MPWPLLAMLAPGAIQSGFGLAGLLSKRKKFEGTSRGRMLGRQAGEGQFSSQEEREMQNRLLQALLSSAGEETEEIKRVAFPMLEKSKLAGARLLSAPYRDVRAKMTDAELRLQAGERRAAMEAGEQFGAEREQFETREDARRGAFKQQLAGGLGGMAQAGMQYAGAKSMGLLKEGAPYADYAKMSLLGMRPPAYFRPTESAAPSSIGDITSSSLEDLTLLAKKLDITVDQLEDIQLEQWRRAKKRESTGGTSPWRMDQLFGSVPEGF